ncbi:MAG: hypothetical protein JWN41_1658 [Thermoleophilia bacterium]|nr:hypothetical protein [Thermoleophilia bacterium]
MRIFVATATGNGSLWQDRRFAGLARFERGPHADRMDPLPVTTDESSNVDSVEMRNEQRADESAALRDAGDLAEAETLLGAVMVARNTNEADAMRDALDLDQVPATAVPSHDEQAKLDEVLRESVVAAPATPTPTPAHADAVLADSSADDRPADVTEAFEVHDAALSGDRIAQAIEAAAADRATREYHDSEQASRADAFDERDRDVASGVHAADERRSLDEASAEGASAARAGVLDTTAAGSAVAARASEQQTRQQGSDEAARVRARDDDQAASEARAADTRGQAAERVRREADQADNLDRANDDLARERSLADARDHATQLAGSAATTQHGGGRPPARITSRSSSIGDDERVVERTHDVAPVTAEVAPGGDSSNQDDAGRRR